MDFQRLFDVALAGPLSRTVGGNRRYLVTLKGGRSLMIDGIYEPRHEELFSEGGVEVLRPWPRIQLRRAQLIAGGVTDPNRGLSGARVLIGEETFDLDQVRDDGYVFVAARTSSVGPSADDTPIPRII